MDKHSQVTPCGLVCRTCSELGENCAGCFDGGGEEDCYIRTCTAEKGLAGCWECDTFPCQYLTEFDPSWRGLFIGFIDAVREVGPERYTELAFKALGEYREFDELRGKSAEEAKRLILDA